MGTLGNTIKGALTAAWDFIKSTAETVWNAIKQFFMDWWPVVVGIFLGPIGVLAGMIYKFHDEIYAAILAAWDKIKGAFSDAWGAIKEAFDTAWTKLKDAFQAMLDFFTDKGTKIKDFFLAIPGYITSGLSGLYDAFTGPFKTAWDWINTHIVQPAKAFFNWLAGEHEVGGTVSGLSNTAQSTATFSAPHALGGLFTKPHVGLVAEDGPELILPLSKPGRTNQLLAQAGLTTNNNQRSININVLGNDGVTIGRQIAAVLGGI